MAAQQEIFSPSSSSSPSSGLLVYESFDTPIENVFEALQRDGVCVVPDVLTAQELELMRDGLWDTLGHLTQHFETPVARDASTWHAFQELKPIRNVMLHDFGIGQAQVAWDVRQNPRVAQVFSRIWKAPVESLLTSMDGMSVHFPDELIPEGAVHPTNTASEEKGRHRPGKSKPRSGDGEYESQGAAVASVSAGASTQSQPANPVAFYGGPASDWFHVDQAPGIKGMRTVQGLINAWDVSEGDATLAVLRGSHKHLSEFAHTFGFDKEGLRTNFFNIRDGPHRDFFDAHGCQRVNVKCKAGSLVLWDSRTVHCGCLPQRGRADPKIRFVVYVCMIPRPLAESECKRVLDLKQQTVAQQGTTSHNPLGDKVFLRHMTHTRTGHHIPDLPTPALTSLGRRLAGLD